MAERALDKLGEPGRRAALLVLALAACVLVVSLLDAALSPGMAVGSLLLKLGSMWPAAVYLGAGFGLGWPVVRCLGAGGQEPVSKGRGASEQPEIQHWSSTSGTPGGDLAPVQFAVGLAVIFSVSEVLGVLGLLNAVTAIGVCAIGLGLLGWQAVVAVRAGARIGVPGLAWMLAFPAVAVLVVASAMPPGWLWGSEFGGFDALSYHLELPQEWLGLGQVVPLEHNVYSFLPGYIEAAFAHLGWMTLAPERGLLGGDGWRLISCQALHAGLTVLAAWLTARATRRVALQFGVTERVARWGGAMAGCVALATPWAVVTGSLAYNEGGVNAMFAGALLVAVQPRLRGGVRGALVGLLVGVACGFKPTSMFFVGVPAGLLMVQACWRGEGGRRAAGAAVAAGAFVGLVALAPWLIRNWAHGGNPVFPFAASLFGTAHWTAEQVARFDHAHAFDGTLVDRLRTLVWTSPGSSPGDPAVERFRGLANPQWGLAAVLCLGALAVLVAWWREARGTALVLLCALGSQLVAWLVLTHLQSRFLLPMLPPGAMVVGLALARLRAMAGTRTDARAGAALLGGVVVAAQTGFLFAVCAGEAERFRRLGGRVGLGLALFPESSTGLLDDPPDGSAVGWCNETARAGGLVYLVGDSTPLYFGPHVLYHTTYDASPLGELMRGYPEDPAAWASGLRERGVAWLLVNPFELRRLSESGWYDPEVTSASVHRFAEELGGAARVWQNEGRYAVRIPEAGAAAGGGGR